MVVQVYFIEITGKINFERITQVCNAGIASKIDYFAQDNLISKTSKDKDFTTSDVHLSKSLTTAFVY